MLALLPLFCCAALALAHRCRALPDGGESGWRRSFFAAAVGTGLAASLAAEILGALGLLTRGGVLGFWLLAAAISAFLWFRGSRPRGDAGRLRERLDAGDAATLAGLCAVALAVGLTALAAAPNNWDSLTYHLPRVLHWVQDRSLQSYPTPILRQLTLSPGAEVLLAHLGLLTDSDRLWNLLQWLAWVGCMAAASSVAERLGAGRAGRILAAVFAATLPMAILQASSTQNDLVAGFWLLVFVDALLRARESAFGRMNVLVTGGALALAVLTKTTAALFALPFLLWLAAGALRRQVLRAVRPLLAVAAIVLAVNAGWWSRNLSLFGSPLGPDYGTVNRVWTPAVLASNLLRNAALHLALPSERWNSLVERGVVAVHRVLGIGVEDERSTWKGAVFHVPPGLRGSRPPDAGEILFGMLHDDRAGNLLHLLLLVGAAGLLLARRKPRWNRPALAYLAAVGVGALLFCLILKWQPWNTRLQLPLFLLGAPLAAAALASGVEAKWARRFSAALLALCLPWVLVNATRPLVGPASVLTTPRLEQYFAGVPGLLPPLAGAARAVFALGCRDVGLELRPDDPEYLLWRTLEASDPAPRRVEDVGARNRSATLLRVPPFAGFTPCAVISLAAEGAAGGRIVFSREWPGGRVTVRAEAK